MNAFDDAPPALGLRARAPVSVMLASLVTILPFVATFPVLPPFGLMLLLGWRLRRPDALPIWAPLPLGLFDDLASGQPLGSAIVLWTFAFFSIDLIERRVMLRGFWQDWLIAAGGITAALIGGRLIAAPLGAHVDTVLLIQISVSILLFPVAASLCGRLDARGATP
ncbi:MAG: rod shape-determining protein MreD [Pseudomonadota bacterium]